MGHINYDTFQELLSGTSDVAELHSVYLQKTSEADRSAKEIRQFYKAFSMR